MQGGTELFMESAEPTFDELPLDQLSGAVARRAVRVPRRRPRRGDATGSARLTHDLPAGPVLVSPIQGDRR